MVSYSRLYSFWQCYQLVNKKVQLQSNVLPDCQQTSCKISINNILKLCLAVHFDTWGQKMDIYVS